MNPFFPNQYPIPSQPSYYPYPESQYSLPQQHSTPTSNTIQSMYSSVQPYLSKQFLLTTFRSNADQIKIFLSLAHEDKLKLYLLTEQKKIYGDMSDKQGYQKILQQIATKLHNYQLFHQQGKQQKIENSEQKKKKELESKIDQFCQTGFQKLHLPFITGKMANEEQKSIDNSHHQQEAQQQQQQQWIQSTPEQQPKIYQQPASYSQQTFFPSYQNNSFNNQNNKQNVMIPSKTNNVVYSMFTFDSQTQKALTRQIGLKTAIQMQRQSIWDLEIDQSELVSNQPNIKEVFKKKEIIEIKEQKNKEKIQQKSQSSRFNFNYHFSDQLNQSNSVNSNNFGELYNFPIQSQSNDYQQSSSINNYSQQNSINPPQQSFQFDFQFNNPIMQTQNQNIFSTVSVPVYVQTQEVSQSMKSTQQEKQNNDQQDNQQFEDEWQQAEPNQAQEKESFSQQTQNKTKQEIVSNNLSTGIMDFTSPQQYVYQQPNYVDQNETNQYPSKQSENIFDFDFFQAKVQTETPIIQQNANIFLFTSNSYVESPQSPITQTILPTAEIQSFPTVVELQSDIYQQNTHSVTTQLFLPDNQKRYEIINNLKIQLKESQKNRITKSLKTKSFECDPDFYLTIMNYLKELSLEDSPQYSYFAQQHNIVKEIHELTSNNTSIVSQEDEQKIQRALRQTKSLYNKIYNNSAKIQKMTEHLINDKNKEKGILYKLGRVLIDSGINNQLISRAGNQPNNRNIFQSFCLLFILQKSNQLNKLKTNTEQIISYFTQEYGKYKQLDENTFLQAEQSRQKYPQIVSYIRGLLKIASICERTIGIMKLCCIKSSANLVKTLKNTKQILNKFSSYQQPLNQEYFPSQYGEILRQSIKKNISLYELHTRFSEGAQKSPICQLCLLNIDNQGEKIEEKGWFHYSCFNLLEVLANSQHF